MVNMMNNTALLAQCALIEMGVGVSGKYRTTDKEVTSYWIGLGAAPFTDIQVMGRAVALPENWKNSILLSVNIGPHITFDPESHASFEVKEFGISIGTRINIY
jgi:hypothetical protein